MSKPKTQAERSKAWRRRQGIEARQLKPHGTRSAAQRHRRAGEKPCAACAQAEREYVRAASSKRSKTTTTKKEKT